MKEMLVVKKVNILPVHVSLDELIQLNNISISNNYNRSLIDDFPSSLLMLEIYILKVNRVS